MARIPNLLIVALLISSFHGITHSQATKAGDLHARVQLMEDRIALKNLVDTFSILADVKNTQAQTLLFSDSAVVETHINGKLVTSLKGRKAIGEAFAAFLNRFETVYHINGQQTLNISGNRATGISYCEVTLIGKENGKGMKTNIGVRYQDEYSRVNYAWVISRRKSTFDWQIKEEMK